MSEKREPGYLAIFGEVDAAAIAIEKLREKGLKDIVVFSPVPRHELEHALHAPESPVRMFTLVGALTGTATGFALAIGTSLDWPLITGGKPIISLPAFVVPAFELTILFGALSTVLGLLINARLPHVRKSVVYDPSFSVDKFGVFAAPPPGQEEEVKAVLRESGALEVREQPREVRIG
jgi:molybdopterin-containing oxidoreductase family membrane subunit